jgi:hypothetical protein
VPWVMRAEGKGALTAKPQGSPADILIDPGRYITQAAMPWVMRAEGKGALTTIFSWGIPHWQRKRVRQPEHQRFITMQRCTSWPHEMPML